ncbi:putative transporter [Operophtera brumata]|uniref:Putative transporter n=1 Tax=Operophtera brumata TaxID=104452 RepID=A0A0L7LDV0_OPEBR|nr:putative transporter [Operophtera brumata]
MKMLRSFVKRITTDLKQKKLIPLKVLFFVHASTLFVLYPYLTIHMRELGINVEETAIMSAVTPVVSIVMPPLAGMLADKIGGASALLLLVVPVGRITVTFPPSVELLVTCESSGLRLRNMQEYSCLPVHPYAHDINLTVLSCGFVCELPEDISTEDVNDIVYSHAYDVHLQSRSDSQRLLYRHTVTSQLPRSNAPMKDQSTSRIMTNDPNFNTSVSRVSENEIFFPTPQLYDMECSQDFVNATCLFGNNDIFAETTRGTKQMVFRARVTHDAQKDPIDVRNYWVKALAIGNIMKLNEDYDGIDNITCQDKFDMVRVFIGIIGGTAFAMFEGAVIAIVREQKADYGMQRVYGMLKIASGVLMLSIDLEFKQPAQNLLEDVIHVFKNIEIVALFLACFVMGTAWGYIESFLFWLLQDLGASRSLMGITITVGGVAGLPLLVLSGPIIRRLGHANVIFIGFVFYAIRLMGYSLIYNPWLCLIFEALESVTSSLAFTAAVTYAARLSSTTTDTSVQGLLGGIYFGVVTYAARLSSTTTDTSVQGLLGGIYFGVVGDVRGASLVHHHRHLGAGPAGGHLLRSRQRAMSDENDICKKRSPTDIEDQVKKEITDVAIAEVLKDDTLTVTDAHKMKLVADNTDGGSDSGVENPAYNDTETISNGTKKEDPKTG